MQNKAKYLDDQMNVSTIITRGYEDITRLRPPKKQSQTKPNKAKFKKAKMNVTSILTKGYENKPPIRAPKKQTQISKRQKPMQTSLPQRIMKKTAISGSDKTKPNKAKQTQLKPISKAKKSCSQPLCCGIYKEKMIFCNRLTKKYQID